MEPSRKHPSSSSQASPPPHHDESPANKKIKNSQPQRQGLWFNDDESPRLRQQQQNQQHSENSSHYQRWQQQKQQPQQQHRSDEDPSRQQQQQQQKPPKQPKDMKIPEVLDQNFAKLLVAPSRRQREVGPMEGDLRSLALRTEYFFGSKVGWPYPEMLSPQRSMAVHITKALNDRKHVVLESPTGTGKSAAILCSVLGKADGGLLYAFRNAKKRTRRFLSHRSSIFTPQLGNGIIIKRPATGLKSFTAVGLTLRSRKW